MGIPCLVYIDYIFKEKEKEIRMKTIKILISSCTGLYFFLVKKTIRIITEIHKNCFAKLVMGYKVPRVLYLIFSKILKEEIIATPLTFFYLW